MQYVGFDAHKKYTFFTQMDADGVIQRQGKLANDRDALSTFFAEIDEPARVVIEASMNWYHLYDLLESLEIPVTLAHPLRTRAIAEAKVKTDKVDSTILAHLLRTDLVPAAYIPPREIRDLRELLRYRAAQVKLQTMLKNRVHAVLLKHGYHCPCTDAFGIQGRVWLGTLPLRPVYQQALRGFLTVLDTLQTQIREASRTINQQAKATPIVGKLCALPGVGHYTALLVLAEIGDVQRFPDPKHLVSYAGLAPRVHQSGSRIYTGHISKQGSSWLRWILIEAAMHAGQQPGRYQKIYARIAQRKGRKLARVVVAREMLTTIYWMLQHAH